jgi:protein-tyrosine phosphatase
VLVHSKKGANRGAVLIAAYLIKFENFSFEEAFKAIRDIRSSCFISSAFMKQLFDW